MKGVVFLLILCAVASASEMNDDPLRVTLMADRLEQTTGSWGDWDRTVWDLSGDAGYDMNRLTFYSEGSRDPHESESQNELLLSRAVAPFWNVELGAELDTAGDGRIGWGVLALQGLAPYYFETRLKLMMNNRTIALNAEAEYELLLTQRLILTPRIEVQAYSHDIEPLSAGSGIASLETGLRLRYEFVRRFAPYLGFTYASTFGTTRHYDAVDDLRAVGGIRFWF